MRNLAITLAIAALAWATAAPARAETDVSARAAVIALENEWLEHEHDAQALDRILADDFVHALDTGDFITKRQQIEWAAHHPAPAGRSARFVKLDVRVYGTTAIANGLVETKDAPGSAPMRTVFTDVFVFRQGRWQAVNAQENALGPRF